MTKLLILEKIFTHERKIPFEVQTRKLEIFVCRAATHERQLLNSDDNFTEINLTYPHDATEINQAR